ncbi:hypothetical protein BOVATA_033480 [Babesia ovata]|uniref:Uncharacterized protein n=1 Tax=Babesia ovata TaxID=189622 RepID=A0A2H6KFT4_9APIC|nr:uncharacterized protein BOVATA_033480 [Babesia ovata]GBE61855.1 hypothetical protein BOVATA_033480 [Babesia ovata]
MHVAPCHLRGENCKYPAYGLPDLAFVVVQMRFEEGDVLVRHGLGEPAAPPEERVHRSLLDDVVVVGEQRHMRIHEVGGHFLLAEDLVDLVEPLGQRLAHPPRAVGGGRLHHRVAERRILLRSAALCKRQAGPNAVCAHLILVVDGHVFEHEPEHRHCVVHVHDREHCFEVARHLQPHYQHVVLPQLLVALPEFLLLLFGGVQVHQRD